MIAHRVAMLCVLVIGASALDAFAQSRQAASPERAVISYDVKLREFRCWREEPLTSKIPEPGPACSGPGWHPVTSSLYFLRGEAIDILLVGGAAGDLFSLEVKTEELSEPSVPVQGSLASLPKMVALSPPPATAAVKGPEETEIEVPAELREVKPVFYRLLTIAAGKDFPNAVKTQFIEPFAKKEVDNVLAMDVETAVSRVSAGSLSENVKDVRKTIEAITTPTTTRQLVDEALALKVAIESASALGARATSSGMAAAGKTILDAAAQLRSPAVSAATSLNSGQFSTFTYEFEAAFPADSRYERIKALTINDDGDFDLDPKYPGSSDSYLREFLDRVKDDAVDEVNKDMLGRLRANLTALADMWTDVTAAARKAERLTVVSKIVRENSASLTNLQAEFNALADAAVEKAAELNTAARQVPLDDDLRILRVGQWFSSTTVTVTLKQGQRVPLFDVSGVGTSVRTDFGEEKKAGSASSASASLSEVRTLNVRIYNLYRFKLGVGFLRSSADNDEFEINSGDTGTFIDQVQSRNHTLLTTAALIVYPTARHAFPWRPRFPGERGPAWYESFGAMAGFSVTSPGSDIVFGGVWFPRLSPVGVQVGWHIALRDYPPAEFDLTQPIPASRRVVTLEQRRVNGLAMGLIFTSDFFTNVFASIFKQ